MTALELAKTMQLTVLVEGDGAQRDVTGIYCCDLLSIVMGRASSGDAWITVMSNINAVAVAVLSDVACILLSEGMQFDAQTQQKAEEQGVCVLQSDLPTFTLARRIAELAGL